MLLSVPIFAIVRSYGLSLDSVGSHTVTYFKNKKGLERVKSPFNPEVEERIGIKGWHYGVLRFSVSKKLPQLLLEEIVFPGHEFVSYTEHDRWRGC